MMLREAKRATLQRSADGRGTARRDLRLQTGGIAEGGIAEVLIHNLSITGALIETEAELETGDWIELELPHAGGRTAAVVWSDDGLYGCRFAEPLTKGAISAALLRSSALPAEAASAEPTRGASDTQATAFDDDYESEARRDDKLHPAMRLLVIAVFTLACWAAIFALSLAAF